MPKLILKFQGVLIKEYNLLDKLSLTIGRKEDNDICIDHMSVSGHHARIDKVEEPPVIYFTVTDLNSTNGAFVNGKRITTATTFKLNDWITIGKHILYFK